MDTTLTLDRPSGRIGFDIAGDGPLVVCIPGMGDLRAGYRFLAPALVEAGYRVATMDLRGHGDSDVTFTDYDDRAAAGDAVALVELLGGPAILVGNSMGAGAAVIAAAEHPDAVSGLVLLGPFVRNPPTNPAASLFMRAAMVPAWAAPMWNAYLPSLYRGRRPVDFDEYRQKITASMRRPGRSAAFSRTTRTSHDPAEKALDLVGAPALVVMGALDPDFASPAAEAAWIGEKLSATVAMIDDAGHYPHSQRPDIVNVAVIDFLGSVGSRA